MCPTEPTPEKDRLGEMQAVWAFVFNIMCGMVGLASAAAQVFVVKEFHIGLVFLTSGLILIAAGPVAAGSLANLLRAWRG